FDGTVDVLLADVAALQVATADQRPWTLRFVGASVLVFPDEADVRGDRGRVGGTAVSLQWRQHALRARDRAVAVLVAGRVAFPERARQRVRAIAVQHARLAGHHRLVVGAANCRNEDCRNGKLETPGR